MRASSAGVVRGVAAPDPVGALFAAAAASRMRCPPDRVLRMQGDPIDSVLRVESGLVRCCLTSRDGRRRIVRFAGKGRLLGFTGLGAWRFTVEAVDAVVASALPLSAIEAAVHADPCVCDAVRAEAARELAAREQHLVILASRHIEERLLWFLECYAATRASEGFVALPMPRRDVADYLAMTVESVSRAFGALKQAGRVEMLGPAKFRLRGGGVSRAA